jgi:group I intron endonuclease
MGYIYMIKNKINGKLYIGQTIRKNLNDRWRQHKSCKKDTVGNYLYNAYNKYGINNFDYKLICICFDEDCNKFEEDYIKKYNSIYPNGYNLKSGGNNHKLSEETKQLLRDKNKGKVNPNKGKKMSEEQKQKLRESAIKWHSSNKITIKENTKNKISESLKIYYKNNKNSTTSKRCIKIEQYDLSNNYIKTFNSINSAAKEIGITQMMINRASSNEEKYAKYKTAKGFIWKRVEI